MNKGFTLAELLISLTIAGIVAVLTIPGMVRNAQYKSNVAKLQSTYTQLQDAVKQALAEQKVSYWEDTDFGGSSDRDNNLKFLQSYLNVSKDCTSDYTGCFAVTYNEINNSRTKKLISHYGDNSDNAYVILTNGAALSFGSKVIFIDVNGKSDPNTLGRDIFGLFMDEKGNIGTSGSNESLSSLADECRSFDGYVSSCVRYLEQNNWKMDY